MDIADLKLINALDTGHANARARVMAALSGDSTHDEDRLIRWMITEEINPHSVFIDWPADCFFTYEGLHGLLGSFGHAFRDDGDVSFFETDRDGPKIVFLAHDEVAAYVKTKTADHLYFDEDDQPTQKSLEVTKILDGVDAFIASYTAHEAAYQAAFAEYWDEEEISPAG